MTRIKHLIGAGFMLGLIACTPPSNEQHVLVQARAVYISAATTFAVYASQQWCDTPDAPPHPLCADKGIVRQGANASKLAVSALNTADAVLLAGGRPDLTAVSNAVNEFILVVKETE